MALHCAAVYLDVIWAVLEPGPAGVSGLTGVGAALSSHEDCSALIS